jgi:hypothetical protein
VGRLGGWCWKYQTEYPSQWKAIQSIAEKLRLNHESVRPAPHFAASGRARPISVANS